VLSASKNKTNSPVASSRVESSPQLGIGLGIEGVDIKLREERKKVVVGPSCRKRLCRRCRWVEKGRKKRENNRGRRAFCRSRGQEEVKAGILPSRQAKTWVRDTIPLRGGFAGDVVRFCLFAGKAKEREREGAVGVGSPPRL
jgi:hypothetical protein